MTKGNKKVRKIYGKNINQGIYETIQAQLDVITEKSSKGGYYSKAENDKRIKKENGYIGTIQRKGFYKLFKETLKFYKKDLNDFFIHKSGKSFVEGVGVSPEDKGVIPTYYKNVNIEKMMSLNIDEVRFIFDNSLIIPRIVLSANDKYKINGFGVKFAKKKKWLRNTRLVRNKTLIKVLLDTMKEGGSSKIEIDTLRSKIDNMRKIYKKDGTSNKLVTYLHGEYRSRGIIIPDDKEMKLKPEMVISLEKGVSELAN